MSESDKSRVSPELKTYLGALHDIIASYHTRLSEVTSPKVANQFLATMSDSAIHQLGLDQSDSMEDLRQFVTKLGMKLTIVPNQSGSTCTIECPFANQVLPVLTSKTPICPITILALGAARTKQKGLTVTKMTLNEKGSETVIRKPDELNLSS